MSQNQNLVIENLRSLVRICPIKKIQIFNSEITVVCDVEHLIGILCFFKKHLLCQFKILSCLSGSDYPQKKNRFKIVYELLSVRYNIRVRVAIYVNELCTVDSAQYFYSTSSWYECEIFDMFGVFFRNHPNLKRILTDYGFEGFPLRKDFPLSGFVEMKYNDSKKRVVSEILEFSQEYRVFKFLSPWKN